LQFGLFGFDDEALFEKVPGTLTKKLILRLRFFMELNMDFDDADSCDERVGGREDGPPMTEIPPDLPNEAEDPITEFPVSGCPMLTCSDLSDSSVEAHLIKNEKANVKI
jgi:hypothetical protein